MIVDRARVVAALPGYELGDQIGAGAFGLVLAGWHRGLQRDVAIKVMGGGHARAVAGFATEARILANLDHPHVIRVYDYVETDDLRLLVMEMLAGGTLTRRQPGLSQEGACAVGLAVAAALACAHSRGVLHRDIKPDNVLFDTAGLLKVADFGIAKLVDGSAATASAVIGTPLFMAPEQLAGGRLGPATDLYALGVVLYLLLAGVAPGDPALPADMRHHVDRRPSPAGVPAPVAKVVMRALARDPAVRPRSAHAFALDLARAAAGVYGPDWIARSGIVLRLDDDLRAAAERPAASSLPSLPPAPDGGAPSPDPARDTPWDDVAGGPATRGGRRARWRPRSAAPPRRRRRRAAAPSRRIVAAVAVLLLAVGGAILTVTVLRREASAHPLGPPLTGHTGWVFSVTFSPDGHTLATGSHDKTVRLWDVRDPATPHELGQPLTGHTHDVGPVAFSLPDGRTLASSSADGTVLLWNVANPSAPRPLGQPLTAHTDWVTSVAFSPDGLTLATSSRDKEKKVQLWDVTNPSAPGPLGQPLTGHTDWVQAVIFSPDGHTLATGSADGVRLWDVANPSAPRPLGQPLTGHTGGVYGVAFSPDGRTLAAATGTASQLWDVTDREAPRPLGQPLTGHTQSVKSVTFSPDGRILATASLDRTIRLWDVTDRSDPRPLGQPLTGHTDWVSSVAFSPDGGTLATSGKDGTVRLWAVD